jgi:hypothetical protein
MASNSADFDDANTGMVYFDLPDVTTEDKNTSGGATKVVMGTPLVDQFLRFIFSLFMLEWLQKNDRSKQKITKS